MLIEESIFKLMTNHDKFVIRECGGEHDLRSTRQLPQGANEPRTATQNRC